MRALIPFLFSCLVVFAPAAEWKNEIFHCAANIPESPGWQVIDAPPVPGIAPVLVMQNATKGAAFGISVVEKYRDAKISDVTMQRDLEAQLRQFGYAFVGHATVKSGGFDWLQYPVSSGVGAQQARGLIRYASAGGYLFSITMLRFGGQEAAQDIELHQAAASFRILPAEKPATVPPTVPVASVSQTRNSDTAKGGAKAPPVAAVPPGDSGKADAPAEEKSNAKLIWACVAGVLVLVTFASIITRNPAQKR